ncbi:MAG TPA: hypothetical protein VF981_04835 [Gemmatimonadaceae bacterium]|jgi:hypothetical protein
MYRIIVSVAIVSLAAPFRAPAQQHPDFSGVWTAVDPTPAGPSVASRGDLSFRVGDMGSGWGSPITVAQQAARLSIEFVFFARYDLQPPLRFVYALDGSTSRNTVMIGHAAAEQVSRAVWQGNTLVITTHHPVPDMGEGGTQTAEVRQVLSLDSSGSLVVETTRVGLAAAPTRVSRTVYTKG